VKPLLDQLRVARHVTPPADCIAREVDLEKRTGP